ncbi:DUF2848 domain-containing protein [Mycoavidus sp. SF9855]|uniref:DUF2848 domain-containing protein n=1 Tax=Mycoavidus sp. SF9855 TaxID=2968475 RepID=UPI00211C133D|nr:DUF2848 domain-containing protein [Mycoavidus sp. SF9855]UUM21057.1 DUF2848 domain-containing protein [Mycoavidus sp. SF9855]
MFNIDKSLQITEKLNPQNLIIAGWTGRNISAVQRHIEELAELGVTAPKKIPALYKVSSTLLTTADSIEVVGMASSGEAEFCLFYIDGKCFVRVGSDHTDRKLEVSDITLSKQVCAKPISAQYWSLEDVIGHWDELILKSYVQIDTQERFYQDGSVREILHPTTLLTLCESENILTKYSVLFSGTLPIDGPFVHADYFRCELIDPVLGRALECAYQIKVL